MNKNFISEPMDFHYKEGNAVDFEKTFDLTGNDNDQMLRVYLRKAGLSDNIECLSPEQRKAFIYDIVKSNKNPGYWKPSVLPAMSPNATVRSVRVPVEPQTPEALDSIDDIPQASLSFDFQNFSRLNSSHSNGEQTMESANRQEVLFHAPLCERQFQDQQFQAPPKIYNTPPTPPSPSTLVTRKGLKIEISGPKNFVHVSGDMTRDMTKNAFDLSGQFSDKHLKKYMIERGIADEDIEGMDKKDLVRKIIQSRYTWVPSRKAYTGSVIPPPPSETYRAPSPTAPPRHKHHSKGGALIVQPPVLPSNNSASNGSIYLEVMPPEPSEAPVVRRPVKPPPPAPPVSVKNSANKSSHSHVPAPCPPPPPPPPPPNHHQSQAGPIPPIPNESKSTLVINPGKALSVPPPPPPMPNLIATGGAPPPPPPMLHANATGDARPPPPPMPVNMNASAGGPPPPPPPPPSSSHPTAVFTPKAEPVETGGDSRDAFLESIRAGISLKKVNKDIQVKTHGGTVKLPSSGQSKIPSAQVEAPPKPIRSEKPDFMSELRNATLKRIKKLENNPHAEQTSESYC